MSFVAYHANVSSAERLILSTTLDRCINEIWESYDRDNNGILDMHEARRFLKDVLRESG